MFMLILMVIRVALNGLAVDMVIVEGLIIVCTKLCVESVWEFIVFTATFENVAIVLIHGCAHSFSCGSVIIVVAVLVVAVAAVMVKRNL